MTHSTSIARFVPYMTEQFSMADFITTAFLKGEPPRISVRNSMEPRP